MQQESVAILLAGLSFGDEGKGTMVDYLVRKYQAHSVFRYNGGAQAAHNVVDSNGRHHTFSQFGSGSLVPGVRTYLSRFMLIEPAAMMNEERGLQRVGVTDAFDRTIIDGNAVIITPLQVAANRLLELARGNGRHGSCGRGVGQTMQDFKAHGDKVLFAKDLGDKAVCRRKLRFLRELKNAQLAEVIKSLPNSNEASHEVLVLQDATVLDRCLDYYARFSARVSIVDESYFHNLVRKPGTMVFEGAQGMLLDVNLGFTPHTTKTDISFHNAEKLLAEAGFAGKVKKVGVLRAYGTRHGAGPFVTEDSSLASALPEIHNGLGKWQGNFRVGYFDALASRYALTAIGGVEEIALTHVDCVGKLPELNVAVGYEVASLDQKYFQVENGIAKNIAVAKPSSEEHQTGLTSALQQARPIYKTIAGGQGSYVRFLEQELNAPISVLSFGPKAQDKREATTLCYRAA